MVEPEDPERLALRWLARRPLAEAELANRLRAAGHAAEAIRPVVKRLRDAGYVDDRALARHYIATRVERLGHAPARSADELERRGLSRELIDAVLAEIESSGEIDPAEPLRRRVAAAVARAGGGLDRRAFARVYNQLLRAGFDAEAVRAALESHRVDDDNPADGAEGFDDAFP